MRELHGTGAEGSGRDMTGQEQRRENVTEAG